MRHFKNISSFMKEADYGLVAALDRIGAADIPMKGLCRPELPVCLLRVANEITEFYSFFFPYNVRTSRPLIDNQTIDPIFVKQPNPGAKTTFGDL